MKVDGCEEAKADWEKGWAWAKYDPARTSPEELVKAINENTPFEASVPEKEKKFDLLIACTGDVTLL